MDSRANNTDGGTERSGERFFMFGGKGGARRDQRKGVEI